MVKMKIRKAIELAQKGATRSEIISYFGLTENEYKKQLATFSSANRKKLKNLLISNGKRKKSNSVAPPVQEVTISIWDTSYILSEYCIYKSAMFQNVVILPQVYEQLMYHEKNGNKKICKFFHMILDGRIKVKLEQNSYVPKKIPSYEDPADLEIVEYSKQNSGSCVYTTDKGLALRCFQQNIKYQFFDINNEKVIVSENDKSNANSYEKNLLSKEFIVKKGNCIGIDPNSGAIVYDRKFRVKKPNKHWLIPFEVGYMIFFEGKIFKILSLSGELEEMKTKA